MKLKTANVLDFNRYKRCGRLLDLYRLLMSHRFGMTTPQIMSALGLSRRTCNRLMNRLEGNGVPIIVNNEPNELSSYSPIYSIPMDFKRREVLSFGVRRYDE